MNIPIIVISYLCLIVFGLVDNIRGPLFSEILKEFQVSDFLGSLFFSLSSLFGFLISFSSIYLFKFLSKKTLLIMATVGLFLTFSAYLFINQFYWILILASFYGVFAGLLGLLPNVLVPSATLPHQRQQLLSGLHSMYGMSSLVAPLIGAFIMSKTHSYRMCFFIVSLLSLALFLYSLFIKMDVKEVQVEQVEKTKFSFLKAGFFGISLSMAVLTEVLISSRLPLLLEREYNFDLNHSSLYLTYFFICLLVGRLLFTFIKINMKLSWQVTLFEILTFLSIVLGIYIHPLGFVFAGLFIAPVYPFIAAIIAEKFKGSVDSSMSLIVSMNSLLLAVMHLLVGKISDLSSIKSAFILGPLFLFISVLILNYESIFSKKHKS